MCRNKCISCGRKFYFLFKQIIKFLTSEEKLKGKEDKEKEKDSELCDSKNKSQVMTCETLELKE
jgi:hypothetical protein